MLLLAFAGPILCVPVSPTAVLRRSGWLFESRSGLAVNLVLYVGLPYVLGWLGLHCLVGATRKAEPGVWP